MSNIREVEFSVADIPTMMEAAAKDIREKKHGEAWVGVGVFINEDDELTIYGWGCDADSLHALGLLAAAQAWLAANKVHRK